MRLREWGALTWVGVAWLAGPVPGFADRGVTGQPIGALWWWHLAAAVLVIVAVTGAVRTGELGVRVDRAATRAWAPGRRWRTVVITAWLALAVLAAVQLRTGLASWGDVLTPTAAAAVVAVAPRRSVGGAAVPRLASGTILLAVLAVGSFAVAALGTVGLEDPFAYYRIKELVRAPVGAHNVLAGFLLAGAPAVALAAVRRPRRWWVGLAVVGLGLAATLSRAALVAGAIGIVATRAWLRDRAVATRVGAIVGIGTVGIAVALTTLGAANPDTDGPTSVGARIELWGAAIEAVVEHPVRGVGADGFLPHTEQLGVAAPHEHAHDLPLHAAATSGVPGLLATGAVWLGIAVGAAGQLDRDRRTLVLVALVGMGALAMVDELALRPSTTGVLALLAVTVAAPREPRPAMPGG